MDIDRIRKIIREELTKLNSETDEVIEQLLSCFDSTENKEDWYCGVTGQETSENDLQLVRVAQHYDDDFPDLDSDSICKAKVNSIELAMEVERTMRDVHGFDIGKRQNEPTDDNQIWVYIFRKIEN